MSSHNTHLPQSPQTLSHTSSSDLVCFYLHGLSNPKLSCGWCLDSTTWVQPKVTLPVALVGCFFSVTHPTMLSYFHDSIVRNTPLVIIGPLAELVIWCWHGITPTWRQILFICNVWYSIGSHIAYIIDSSYDRFFSTFLFSIFRMTELEPVENWTELQKGFGFFRFFSGQVQFSSWLCAPDKTIDAN